MVLSLFKAVLADVAQRIRDTRTIAQRMRARKVGSILDEIRNYGFVVGLGEANERLKTEGPIFQGRRWFSIPGGSPRTRDKEFGIIGNCVKGSGGRWSGAGERHSREERYGD
jgi:hypothetical protein